MKTFKEAVEELDIDLKHFQEMWMDFVKHDRELEYLQTMMTTITEDEKVLAIYMLLNDMTDRALEKLQEIGQYMNEVKCND